VRMNISVYYKRMLWIDYVLFNGEEIAKARLEYLNKYVDIFYICEGRYTHQGSRKEVLYIEKKAEWFEEYKDKIRYYVFEKRPEEVKNYEQSHRDSAVMEIIEKESSPYIISGCDIDEIPDLSKMPRKEEIYKKCSTGCVRMSQKFFYYNLNHHFKERWTAPFFINDILLKRTRSIQYYRYENASKTSCIIECGWHFSYFQSAEEIVRKLSSFCHAEYNREKYKDIEHIRACISKGKDLFGRVKKELHRSSEKEIEDVPESVKFLSRNLESA
jgi:hypothetical protein